MTSYKLLIDGRLVDGALDLGVIDPASGEVFATCARADLAQLEQAIAAAKRAFPAWARRGQAEWREHVRRLADALEARRDEIAQVIVREQGKPAMMAVYEIIAAVADMRLYSDLSLADETLRDTDKEKILQTFPPLGVVAAITPWNFPLAAITGKLAPALMAGNTVVVKPAPTTPLTACLLGEIAADILPPGVLNIIIDDNDLGTALTSHPDIAKISFTGSTETGKRVMSSASATLKRLTLELGGNDAAIVLDDVDIAAVAPMVFRAATVNSGQVCLATKRVYVPRAMYDAFCGALERIAEMVVVGDGADPATHIGPLQNERHYRKVLALIDSAREDGGIVWGGEPLNRPGYFVRPAVVRNLPDASRLVSEEQFAPVIPVLAYDTIDEVIARVNDTQFGLGGTVWAGDPDRGQEVAQKIESGIVWVNRCLEMMFEAPHGGAKQSGIGVESGLEGLKAFTQSKIVSIAKQPVSAGAR